MPWRRTRLVYPRPSSSIADDPQTNLTLSCIFHPKLHSTPGIEPGTEDVGMDQENETTWQNAFNIMKTNYSLTDDAIGVFAINLRFNLDDIQTIASEAITGGGDDKKCDILYVDKERQVAVIAQCYLSQRQREAAPSNKASRLKHGHHLAALDRHQPSSRDAQRTAPRNCARD